MAESFEKIEKKEIENIVVDLRDNTGGYVQYEFLTYLFPEKKMDNLGQFVIKKETNRVTRNMWPKMITTEN